MGCTAAALMLCAALGVSAQETPEDREASRRRLQPLSIAELMEVTVFTPGKKDEALSAIPAAVTVVQGRELQRLGLRKIPDVLRYVPGAGVIQYDAGTWGVSIRGMAATQFANRLQVLVDGRSVYSPLFSGVLWDIQDTLLEDIDRIEVIRGPGASVWGANAVNGVVNIITKKSSDTQGVYAAAGAGSELEGFAEGRWGVKLADGMHLRTFVKAEGWDESHEGRDDGATARAGFRLDAGSAFSLIGEFYRLQARHEQTFFTLAAPGLPQVFAEEYDAVGGFITARGESSLGPAGTLGIQASLEVSDRHRDLLPKEHLLVAELELTHELPTPEGLSILWGLSARSSWDEVHGSFTVSYDPEKEHRDLVGAFVQVQAELLPSLLSLLAGTKVEYNDYTGFEYQPTLRASLTPSRDLTFWAAASRALRTPSRTDDDARVNFLTLPGPVVQSLHGSRDVASEKLLAYEAGARARLAGPLTVDAAAFFNRYDDLISQGAPQVLPGQITAEYDNVLEGRTCGVEATLTWRVLEAWVLTGTYALLRVLIDEIEDGASSTADEGLEGDPRHRLTLRSSADLPADLAFDLGLRFTDSSRRPELSSWTELDARLAWMPKGGFEAGLAGRNLLHDRHREAGADPNTALGVTELERSVYAYVAWRF